MRLMATDDVIFQRVADLIRADVTFTAEVLRVANSPLIGRRDEIRGIMHAMAVLGLERLKGLVMTVALRNFLAPGLHVPALLRCWRHSLACAAVAEELAVANWLDKDRQYTSRVAARPGPAGDGGHVPGRLRGDCWRKPSRRRQAKPACCERERARFGADHAAGRAMAGRGLGISARISGITGGPPSRSAAGWRSQRAHNDSPELPDCRHARISGGR